jgi:hypothetical protein
MRSSSDLRKPSAFSEWTISAEDVDVVLPAQGTIIEAKDCPSK